MTLPTVNDFGGSDETVLTRLFDLPIMVYDWPHEIKAFYMKRNPEDPRFARGVDVLAPEGYGEIVGGGERETSEEWLVEKINEHKLTYGRIPMVPRPKEIRKCTSLWFWTWA